jgi:D-amino peptidase
MKQFSRAVIVLGLSAVMLLGAGCSPETPQSGQSGQSGEPLKVLISVDMEGIAGVVTSAECSSSGPDYDRFRKIMTEEANAAVQAALDAGATEVVVRDSHGSARNIFPDLLHEKAKLLRGWSGSPLGMVEGVDETFDAVLFVGYHAKAGTPNGIIAHTMSGNVVDLTINGTSLPEAGVNALIAGNFDVPVIFLAGDRAMVEQAHELFGDIETVSTKDGIGRAEMGKHPLVAQKEIYEGVARAFARLGEFQPYKYQAPYTMDLRVRREPEEMYPGAERVAEGAYTFTSDDILEVIRAFDVLH